MKISTKGRYAVEIMSDLAIYSVRDRLESLRNVAERRGLSEKYLERIIRALKEAGLVISVRGVYGGYCLAKPADQISIHEILAAVEGELAPVECLTKQTACGMECDRCVTRGTWYDMWCEILKVVESVSVADIVNQSTS